MALKLAGPAERLGVAIIGLGAALLVISLVGMWMDEYSRHYFSKVFLFDGRTYYWYENLGRFALYTIAAGACVLLFYRRFILRLIRWIRQG